MHVDMESIVQVAGTVLNDRQLEVFKFVASSVLEQLPKLEAQRCRLQSLHGNLTGSDNNRYEATEENVKSFIRLYKEAADERKKFVEAFPQFSVVRSESVKELKTISKTMHSDRFCSNVCRIFGSLAALICGATVLYSLLSDAASKTLTIGGSTMSAVAATISFFASFTEIFLLQKQMRKAKEILHRDWQEFDRLMVWMKHCAELARAVDKVMGFDLTTKLIKDVKNVKDVVTHSKDLQETMDLIVPIVMNKLGFVPCSSKAIQAVTYYAAFLVSCVMIDSENRFVFSSVVSVHHIAQGSGIFSDVGKRAGVGIALVVVTNALDVVTIALDVEAIALAFIDILKGSVSVYATQVIDAANKMEEERMVLEKCYRKCLDESK